ncbi:hypothetical protein BVAVS116_0325 [Borreliella valaisiana VS116]|uniref:Uncharacterized protein n=1 Tax=Borreliella valaisiana VS116 TaxID=445987 RepID=D6RXG8_BORVA|nr:hypothetical protein BVAVS116_0325 [Borreliella valaisiana VS116]
MPPGTLIYLIFKFYFNSYNKKSLINLIVFSVILSVVVS